MSHRFSVCSRSSLNATPQVHAYRQSSSPHLLPHSAAGATAELYLLPLPRARTLFQGLHKRED